MADFLFPVLLSTPCFSNNEACMSTIPVLTVEQIRQVEAAADAAGYSYAQMMESAGQAVAERALVLIKDRQQSRVTVLVGPGNNGGDGLVAGRLIAQQRTDAQVRFYLLKRRDESDPVFRPVQEAGMFITYAEDDHDSRVLRNMVASSDVLIEALFGIGVRLPLQDEALKILRGTRQALNERRTARRDRFTAIAPAAPAQIESPPEQYVLAVDCPAGLNCDTGELDKNALYADETVTFIAAKPGLLAFPGAAAVGRLYVARLDMPQGITLLEKPDQTLLDHNTINDLLPERPPDTHKGTFGKVMIVAGSVNYTGAAALCAKSAYRSGAGLVTVGAPAPVVASLAAHLLEPTWLMLAHDMGVLSESAAATIKKELENYRVLLLGPGLGRENTTREMLQTLLAPKVAQLKRSIGFGAEAGNLENEKAAANALPPMVIDADGLNLLSEIEKWWTLLPEGTVLTPHPGEMARLCGTETGEVQSNRAIIAAEKAAEWKVTLVLKGANTLIASPDGQIAYSPFKTDALATAGTGDVLAGLIAGLMAQKLNAFDAARAGVYLHGLAGEIAAKRTGSSRGVIASDVLEAIPPAMAAIEVEPGAD
jgi:ADP-dependent NAD(P)H-hydrate dehydratase / NAD(P)H-hydrate epimerase